METKRCKSSTSGASDLRCFVCRVEVECSESATGMPWAACSAHLVHFSCLVHIEALPQAVSHFMFCRDSSKFTECRLPNDHSIMPCSKEWDNASAAHLVTSLNANCEGYTSCMGLHEESLAYWRLVLAGSSRWSCSCLRCSWSWGN